MQFLFISYLNYNDPSILIQQILNSEYSSYFMFGSKPHIYIIFILSLHILVSTQYEFSVFNTGNFHSQNLQQEDLSDSYSLFGCGRANFNVMGLCIEPTPNCQNSFIQLIFNDRKNYSFWRTTIIPFWEQVFENMTSRYQLPQILPSSLNNMNFQSMNSSLKHFWTQAYFLHYGAQTLLKSFPQNRYYQLLLDYIFKLEQLQKIEMDSEQKWALFTNILNKETNKKNSVDYYKFTVQNGIKKMIPCHICNDNFGVIQYGQVSQCKRCPPNCRICQFQSFSLCLTCNEGYFLDLKHNSCQKCSIANCKDCFSETSCYQCIEGYGKKGQLCEECPQGCKKCKEAKCLQCNQLFYNLVPNHKGQCIKCIDQNCRTCNQQTPTLCLSCQLSFYFDSALSKCSKCNENCQQCNNQAQCLICSVGYTTINNKCVKCLEKGCRNCDGNIQRCKLCFQQFSLNRISGNCQLKITKSHDCGLACKECFEDNVQICHSCNQRYFMEDNYCRNCIQGCLSCNNSHACSVCLSGYVLINSICIQCPQNCDICTNVNQTVCKNCRLGFNLIDGRCEAFDDENCIKVNDKKCEICRPGFAANSNGSCIKCISSCSWTCNPLKITECWATRFQLVDKSYYQDSLLVEGCDQKIQNQCIRASKGYQIAEKNNSYTSIRLCKFPCLQCFHNICLKCKQNYLLIQTICVLNVSCGRNCVSCPLETYRNELTNECIQCKRQNCLKCSQEVCFECRPSHYLNNAAECVLCPQQCESCSSQKNCIQCKQGYTFVGLFSSTQLENHQCIKCSSNCLTCKIHESICTSCNENTILQNGECRLKQVLTVSYHLNIPCTTYLEQQKSEQVTACIKDQAFIEKTFIHLKNVSEGENMTTLIKNTIQLTKIQEGYQIIENLQNLSIPGINILGYSITYLNQTIQCKQYPCHKEGHQGQNYVLYSKLQILLISCGVTVFVVIIVFVIILLCKSNIDMNLKYKQKQKSESEEIAQLHREGNSKNHKTNSTKIQENHSNRNEVMGESNKGILVEIQLESDKDSEVGKKNENEFEVEIKIQE